MAKSARKSATTEALRALVYQIAVRTSTWQAARETGVRYSTALEWMRRIEHPEHDRALRERANEAKREKNALKRLEADRLRRERESAARAERRAKARARQGLPPVKRERRKPVTDTTDAAPAVNPPPAVTYAPPPAPAGPTLTSTEAVDTLTRVYDGVRQANGHTPERKGLLVQATEVLLERVIREAPNAQFSQVLKALDLVMTKAIEMHVVELSYEQLLNQSARAASALPAHQEPEPEPDAEFDELPDDLPP